MTRYDRRTFLKHTARASTVAAATVALPELTTQAQAAATDAATLAGAAGAGPKAPARLTVNGLTAAVGVDPDALFFAWRITDGRRGAVQSGAHLQVVDAGTGRTLWRSSLSSAQQAFVPYDGPSLAGDRTYVLRVATADASGRLGPFGRTRFTTGLRDADWQAQWLQPAAAASAPELYRYLRTSRSLPSGQIVRATAFVAAAHKYRLWVNGTEVDSGPSFSYPDESYYQATDITAHLRPGASNVIGALHHWYGPGKGRPGSAPGFLAHVTVEYAGGRRVVIGTDSSWRELAGEWLPAPQRNNTVADFVENIDGRLTPLGWSEPSFDASSWAAVHVLGPVGTAPFTKLYAQRTSITETRIEPVSVHRLTSGAVVVDFGKVYAARPTVAFRRGAAGRTVPMHVGYLLDDDGHVSTLHGTQMTNLSYSYVQRDGPQQFVPYTYIGFRYLEIDDPGEPIDAGQVVALARRATMPEDQTATFTSDDQTLNDVFALTAHSCAYTSQEQFVDTPTREKGPFLWDSAEESMAVLRLFGEQNLSFQGLRDFARSQARFGPDGRLNALYPNSDGARDYPPFTAIYAEWAWQYYLSTGDTATLEQLYPTLGRVADYFAGYRDPATGLLAGVLQSQGDDPAYGFDFSVTIDTPVNVLAANVFTRIDAIGRAIGDTSKVNADRASALTGAINAHLVRPDGIYVDGLLAGGAQSASATQLPNLLALAYGVVPAANRPGVGAYVRAQHISVSPDHGLQLLQALHGAGLDDAVLDTLTDASRPGWAAILRHGGTFTWEAWDPSDLIGDSMSHGWGSSALVAIQAYLLGVDLAAPGAGTADVTVSVPASGLSTASGRVPTVAGPVFTRWRRRGRAATLRLAVPPNVTATVTMPATAADRVTESGKPVARATGVRVRSFADGLVTMTVGSGSYSFVSS
jgi:alpha-L-rhamnosidase